MGVVNRKLEIEHEKVTFDFAAVDVFLARGDRRGLMTEDDDAAVLRQAAAVMSRRRPDDLTTRTALDRAAMDEATPGEPEKISYSARAVKYLIRAAVQTTFPKPDAARKKDRVIFAAWLPALDYDAPDQATLTVGRVDWLRGVLEKLLEADDKGPALPMEMSQWLVATIDYAHDLYERSLASIAGPEGPPAA